MNTPASQIDLKSFVVWIFEHVSILKLPLSICGESVVLFSGHEIILFHFLLFFTEGSFLFCKSRHYSS